MADGAPVKMTVKRRISVKRGKHAQIGQMELGRKFYIPEAAHEKRRNLVCS